MPPLNQALADPAGESPVRADARPPDQVAFDQAVVGFFVEAAGLLGIPKSVAAIYGVVFASPEPLCFADIEARLDLSKGSISQGLRVLRGMGALTAVAPSGERREFFVPDLELRTLVQHWLTERLQKQLAAGGSRLAALNRLALPFERPRREALQRRLRYLKSWHGKASKLLPVVRAFLAVVPRS